VSVTKQCDRCGGIGVIGRPWPAGSGWRQCPACPPTKPPEDEYPGMYAAEVVEHGTGDER
jgi:hypothetical protein